MKPDPIEALGRYYARVDIRPVPDGATRVRRPAKLWPEAVKLVAACAAGVAIAVTLTSGGPAISSHAQLELPSWALQNEFRSGGLDPNEYFEGPQRRGQGEVTSWGA
jgi:hypothetical protein